MFQSRSLVRECPLSAVLCSNVASCNVIANSVKPETSKKQGRSVQRTPPLQGFIKSSRNVFKVDELGKDITSVAFPALLGLAADPLASLVDTAFVGKIGSVELAAVGVAISVFNLTSKVLNIPLLNITTSYVAEENALDCSDITSNKRILPSVSTALLLGSSLGIFETFILFVAAGPILRIMGILPDSPMLLPAQQYLAVRALGAPAVVVSLALEGVFRGFKDTTTPLYSTVTANLVNVVLDPILMFSLGFGVTGAAVATVISQYIMAVYLLWRLNKFVVLVPPDMSQLGVDRFLKSGSLLFTRTVAILVTMTLSTSRAAHEGVPPMAAHQICMQIWLAASLLSDSLALSGQAIIADALAKGDQERARDATFRVLQLGAAFGLVMLAVLAFGEAPFSRIFTQDSDVIQAMATVVPFVIVTQPINSLAFVFDGVLYGASDFGYAAYSMITIGILSSTTMLLASLLFGLNGVWIGLSTLMTLRMLSGALRLGTATGPWRFLTQEETVERDHLL